MNCVITIVQRVPERRRPPRKFKIGFSTDHDDRLAFERYQAWETEELLRDAEARQAEYQALLEQERRRR